MRAAYLLFILAACTGTDDKSQDSAPGQNTAPSVEIVSPEAGATLTTGQELTLTARVEDAEDALDTLSFAWVSDRSGVLAVSPTLVGDQVVATLPGGLDVGEHVLTFSATDPGSEIGSADVNVSVTEDAAPTLDLRAPADGAEVPFGSALLVELTVADDLDAPEDLALSWTGVASATGPSAPDSSGIVSFYVSNLAAGTQLLGVTVADSAGNTAARQISFTVDADADDDGADDLAAGGDDCDDTDPNVHPDASEVCDGLDNNCDEVVDTDAVDQLGFYLDLDGDGFGSGSLSLGCTPPADATDIAGDCDDTDAGVSPAADERCNGLDDNCNGSADEDGAIDADTWFTDADGDGYGDPATEILSCNAPMLGVTVSDDCDDTDAAVSPDATEACNGLDDDCDGLTDGSDALGTSVWYLDLDGDGYGTLSSTTIACDAPVGYAASSTDCDDADGRLNPGATETCNTLDDDCDGAIDEAGSTGSITFYQDLDGDGFGDDAVPTAACDAPTGTSATAGDCDDTTASVSPLATESCNSLDDDCDGTIDETTRSYADNDGDGYGDVAAPQDVCGVPSGYVTNADDCDDDRDTVYPGAGETCNNRDDDCDGALDNDASDATTWYLDDDGDGAGSTTTTVACDMPADHVANTDDCDDADPTVYLGAAELCDSQDNDCDGAADEEAPTWYADADGDGYGTSTTSVTNCTAPSGYVTNTTDCDDSDAGTYPGAPEYCDRDDDDCDGSTSDTDAVDAVVYYADADGDGYGDDSETETACSAPSGYLSIGGDCDDADAAVSPAASEVCNGLDDDCDGAIEDALAVPADYTTIQAAVDAAVDGDLICVAAGSYTTPLDFDGKDVVIEGAGASVTTLDVNGAPVRIENGEGSAARLSGFTLSAARSSGGGALSIIGSSPTLDALIFEDNDCTSATTCTGSVISVSGAAAPTFQDIEVLDTDVGPIATSSTRHYVYGGVVSVSGSGTTATLSDVYIHDVVVDTSAGGNGAVYGGLFWVDDLAVLTIDDLTVESVTVVGHESLYGGLLAVQDGARVDWAGGSVTGTNIEGDEWIYGGLFYMLQETSRTYVASTIEQVGVFDTLVVTTANTGFIYGGMVLAEAFDASFDFTNVIFANTLIETYGLYGGVAFATADDHLSGSDSETRLTFTNVDVAWPTLDATDICEGGSFYAELNNGVTGGTAYGEIDLVNTNVVGTTFVSDCRGGVFGADNSTTGRRSDISYSNFYGNYDDRDDWLDITSPVSSDGNVQVDPGYTSVSAVSSADWDLRLTSSSAVRNAGDPSLLDTDGTFSAIGAYGGPGGSW